MPAMGDPRIRRAQEGDVGDVVGLVHELADYEREPESCHLTEQQLHLALFGEAPAHAAARRDKGATHSRHPTLFCHVAEADGDVVGCALWFRNFSTWEGVHGVYLEDLYVRPSERGSGLGRALLTTLAEECVRHGYGRLEWAVLDWNASSIAFYESLGARPMAGWTTYRLTGETLRELGS